ncbi:MAG: phage major capsid protein [Clostridia bacterium]|nr:phage major capsid protein [Clostridia bacterium]
MLKQVIAAHRLSVKKRELEGLMEKRGAIAAKREALKKREEELEGAVQEITEDAAEEAETAVEEAVAAFEEEVAAVEAEAAENDKAIEDLEKAIDTLQAELDSVAQKVDEAAGEVEQEEQDGEPSGERSNKTMNITKRFRKAFGMTAEEARGFFARQDVKDFAARVRDLAGQKRAISGGELLIPEVVLGLIREQVAADSKLLPYVNLQPVSGTVRQPIMGTVPEAVWTEMCANINEIALAFNEAEVDGYKVGAYIPLCNALKEDNDVNLVEQVVYALSLSLAKALDKAILYGTGTKMPTGIVTRLAQSSQPANYPASARAWVDLRSTNIFKISVADSAGITLFQKLITAFGAAKTKYGDTGRFWVMNHKTHMKLVVEAMSFNAAGAIVTGMENQMPIIGGDIVEIEDVPDSNIIAGYGVLYLLAERAGIAISESEHALFLQDKTVYKATARYDGMPVIAEGFVLIGIDNTDASTSAEFAADDANDVKTINVNTATAEVVVGETIKLTAFTAPGVGTVTWTSGTTAKATVADDGTVTGVAAGSSVITAACNGLTATCTVTVKAAT